VILPLLLIFVALAAAAAVAFGTHPGWAQLEQGLAVILWSRRLQWLLVAVSILACVGLIALSITNRRRAWWLIGLAPVLALFAQRFAAEKVDAMGVAEDPAFVEVDKADFVKDDDWVVALRFADKAYAYPFANLFVQPAVVQTEHDKRLALFWNAYANRVLAFQATPELRGRDLEVVSTPSSSLLVYNAKYGQFICGVTGMTPDRKKPAGLGPAIATTKTTFAKWKAANPAGWVMRPSPRILALGLHPPTHPISPQYDLYASGQPASRPATSPAAGRRRVAVVGSIQPLAVDASSLSLKPNVVKADDLPTVLLRTEAGGNTFRAFGRKIDDLFLRFEPRKDPKLADVRMHDIETDSLWSAGGVAIGGNLQFRGRRLQPLPVDDDVDYEVMKWWVPELEVYAEAAPAAATRPSLAAVAGKAGKRGTKKATPGSATKPSRAAKAKS
jgi:hypothetical protein